MKVKLFKNYPELIYGVSEKKDGSMKIWNSNKDKALKNRENFCRSIGCSLNRLIVANLEHSTQIKVLNKAEKIKGFSDGLITSRTNIFLAITMADCVPILFYAPERKVCGVVHAGWRGTAQKISQQFIKIAQKKFKVRPSQWLVFIGPAIGRCHYEVGRGVFTKFTKRAREKRAGKYFVDLKEENKRQLLSSGVVKENIEVRPEDIRKRRLYDLHKWELYCACDTSSNQAYSMETGNSAETI